MVTLQIVDIRVQSLAVDTAEIEVVVSALVRGKPVEFQLATADLSLTSQQITSLRGVMNTIRTKVIAGIKAEFQASADAL